eukprot:m.385717 g.385717  ORF g.385717 m.385717 type:complete len:304 (+) comp28278_c0_seq1:111-1022(+)
MMWSTWCSTALVLGFAVPSTAIHAGNGTWSKVVDLPTPRSFTQSTTLQDGRVLVAGECPTGSSCRSTANSLATTVVYTPALNSWTPGESMNYARGFVGLVTLALKPSGKVLASLDPTSTAELYDPATSRRRCQWNFHADKHICNTRNTAHQERLSDGQADRNSRPSDQCPGADSTKSTVRDHLSGGDSAVCDLLSSSVWGLGMCLVGGRPLYTYRRPRSGQLPCPSTVGSRHHRGAHNSHDGSRSQHALTRLAAPGRVDRVHFEFEEHSESFLTCRHVTTSPHYLGGNAADNLTACGCEREWL